MADYGVINPITLDEAEKMASEHFMAKAFETFSVAATDRTGFANVLRLRDDFKRGRCNLRRSPDARGAMEQLIKMEERIIPGYIRVGHALFVAFDTDTVQNRPGATFSDYVSEGLAAIYDAMYTFNGNNLFSTYAYWCIKNRLSSFVRNEGRDGISPAIKTLRSKVRSLMREEHITLERAISRMTSENGISDLVIQRLTDCFSRFTHQMSDVESETLAGKQKLPNEELEVMRKMVRATPLEPLERILVEGKLEHGRQFVSMFQQTAGCTNPETGKPFTRARLSQVYIAACQKLREAYNGCEEDVEAEAA